MTEANSSAEKKRSSAITPGRLRNWVELTIQTRQAQRLVQGRSGADGKPAIVGLIRYGALVRIIWSGAAGNDPYADWRLLQIEQALTESRDEMAHLRQTIERDMNGVTAIKVGLSQSLKPTKVELEFTNPYGYMGGWVLADMDELVLTILTARHVGLLKRDDAQRLLQDAGRATRRVFTAAQGYRFMAVKRQDVREGNRKAQRAREHMGELPQAVIDGTLRAEYAPVIDDLKATKPGGHRVATLDDDDTDSTDTAPNDNKDDANDDGPSDTDEI